MHVQDQQSKPKGKARVIQRVIAKATLVHHVCIFDGTTSFLHLVNDRYKQSFTLSEIRKRCSFQSTRTIYCFVLLNIMPVKPETVDCKFRSGWSTVNLPLVKCKSVMSMFQPRVDPNDTTLVTQPGSSNDVNMGGEQGEKQTGGDDDCITSPVTVQDQVPIQVAISEDHPNQSLDPSMLCDVPERSGNHEEVKNINEQSCIENFSRVSGDIKATPINSESEEPPKKRLRTDQPDEHSHEPKSDQTVVEFDDGTCTPAICNDDTHHLAQRPSEIEKVNHGENLITNFLCPHFR